MGITFYSGTAPPQLEDSIPAVINLSLSPLKCPFKDKLSTEAKMQYIIKFKLMI